MCLKGAHCWAETTLSRNNPVPKEAENVLKKRYIGELLILLCEVILILINFYSSGCSSMAAGPNALKEGAK